MINDALMSNVNEPSNQDIKIWRYMSLSKFLQLLQSRGLFFSRSDQFEDPFEGTKSRFDIQNMKQLYKKAFPEKFHEFEDLFNIGVQKEIRQNFKEKVFISCWHMNDSESEGMWKLYGNNRENIAIQTTYNKLREIAASSSYSNISIGMVNYVAYNTQIHSIDNNICIPFFYKRDAFRHEQEVRMVILNLEVGECSKGLLVPVDLSKFIDNIYVSPLASPWFLEVVKDICKKYELTSDSVRQSDLLNDPLD